MHLEPGTSAVAKSDRRQLALAGPLVPAERDCHHSSIYDMQHKALLAEGLGIRAVGEGGTCGLLRVVTRR